MSPIDNLEPAPRSSSAIPKKILDAWVDRVFTPDPKIHGPVPELSHAPQQFCHSETAILHRCLIRNSENVHACAQEWHNSFDCVESALFADLAGKRCPVIHEALQKCLAGPKPTVNWFGHHCKQEQNAMLECASLRATPQMQAWLSEGVNLPLMWRHIQVGA